jgi:hypothetical protein
MSERTVVSPPTAHTREGCCLYNMMQMLLVSQTEAREGERKFSNLMLSNSVIVAPNDEIVYKEWNIKHKEY